MDRGILDIPKRIGICALHAVLEESRNSCVYDGGGGTIFSCSAEGGIYPEVAAPGVEYDLRCRVSMSLALR